MEYLIPLFDNIPSSVLIRIIIEIITIIIGLNSLIIHLLHHLERWRARKNEQEKNQLAVEDIQEIKDSLFLVCNSLKTILADNLNRKCKCYWQNQSIPEDELDEFIKEHDAYNSLHGNSTIDAKFNKVITTLNVKSDRILKKDEL